MGFSKRQSSQYVGLSKFPRQAEHSSLFPFPPFGIFMFRLVPFNEGSAFSSRVALLAHVRVHMLLSRNFVHSCQSVTCSRAVLRHAVGGVPISVRTLDDPYRCDGSLCRRGSAGVFQVDGRSWTAANAEQTKSLLSFETRFTSLWLLVLDYDIEQYPLPFCVLRPIHRWYFKRSFPITVCLMIRCYGSVCAVLA
ncbi:hypothetical protein ARMSODRAFT_774569 [Armillaria solidipes]|uniref:Uncharacterized protein n=1 Tax=Armillaria solidipes TaxID=1076256 RepID=A0A2H3APV2_9AGAR|nr:hypothetical protein ARMSODRAFT_774569 [Armillaria solidipes]